MVENEAKILTFKVGIRLVLRKESCVAGFLFCVEDL